MCTMSRDPRRWEYTICTAVAPEAGFTVRTNGDTPPSLRAQRTIGRTIPGRVVEMPDTRPRSVSCG
jgi:hypothetical protein